MGVDSNCGQVDKNEEMTPSSPSGLPLDVACGDNTLDVETKTGECQKEISSMRKTNGYNTLTEEVRSGGLSPPRATSRRSTSTDNNIIVLPNQPCKPRLEAQQVLTTRLHSQSVGKRGRSDIVFCQRGGKFHTNSF
ncbi:unnamed protein product [Lepeophtheirus salmonis]|uniref:(salmon louse) hypothetical protein n=1 Tax=Lepeophtheirus salmonis TaxID=72036 RepID=A0A7R8D224_LEPSM|nr:unnamed protein product [Lepeophtheirus salmonis]CAF2953623.1 unnamed protein product [Lepeophtheirus salmonis]